MNRGAYSAQAPAAAVMIRPHRFIVNTEIAADNRFQTTVDGGEDLAARARDEIARAAATLQGHGVTAHVFEDEGSDTPDSVVPNNWFSTHAGGHVAIYPMKAESRLATSARHACGLAEKTAGAARED